MDYETPPPPPNLPDEPLGDPPDSEDNPKRGSARERQARRKRTQQAKPAVSPRRQIRPPTEFKMPDLAGFRIPRNAGVLIGAVAAVLFVVILVVALGQIRNDEPEVLPNALWLGTEWTYEDRSDAEVAQLAQNLRNQQIGTVYAWVSWYQYDQTWRGEASFGRVAEFVTQLKAAYPEVALYGWIGVPVQDTATGLERTDYATLGQPVADFSLRVIEEFGFDGIFLNAEQIWDGDENFLTLLRAVRATVGIDTPISAAIPPDWSPSNSSIPLPPLITPGTEWAKEYKQSVALLVDHMAVMAYNSGLSAPSDYVQWVAYQVQAFAQAVGELNTATDLIIGIPTYGAAPPGHDPAVENVITSVEGVKLGIEQAGDAASYVRGLAIYAEWETDAQEWADFQSAWVDG